MKIPYPIEPARREVPYEDRDMIPIRLSHIFSAALILPAIGGAAYVVTRIILSIPPL